MKTNHHQALRHNGISHGNDSVVGHFTKVLETEMVPLEEEEFKVEQTVEVEPPLGFERPQSLSTYKIKGLKVNDKKSKVYRGPLNSKSSSQTSERLEQLAKECLHIGKFLVVSANINEKAAIFRITKTLKRNKKKSTSKPEDHK